jgi:hypothetical protein
MDVRITNFLDRHKICVLSLSLPDGKVHAATCHYAQLDNPLQIAIVTEETSRKGIALKDGREATAAVTIGFSEEEWVELQMSGTVKMVKDGENYESGKEIFEGKFGGAMKPGHVILFFQPRWYRYTEFRRIPPVLIEENI